MSNGDEAKRECAQFAAYQIIEVYINRHVSDKSSVEAQNRMHEFWNKHGNYDFEADEQARDASIVLLRKWYEQEVASGGFSK